MNEFNIIVACDINNGIGKENKLPWNNKDDLLYFSNITKGDNHNCIIMGKNTWDSINRKPLPKRDNLILSRTLKDNNCFDSIDNLIHHTKKMNYTNKWIIGGGNIYNQFITHKNIHIKFIYLTRINENYNCDVFFPKIPDNFTIHKIEKLNSYSSVFIYQNTDYS